MFEPSVNKYNFVFSNVSAPTGTPGTSVVPGASDVEGSWTQIATSGNIAQDIYMVYLLVYNGTTAGQQKDHLLDIGVDPAGGTAYVAVVSNIVCGMSTNVSGNGRRVSFPIFIASGSSVAVRVQGNNATAGTVNIVMVFCGQPSNPQLIKMGQYSETIGTITGSGGVAFTPGNTSAEGAWVSLGTTTRELWWWQLGVQVSNAVVTGLGYTFDLAYGDATNKVMIIENFYVRTTSSEILDDFGTLFDGFCQVPAGSELFIRGSCSGATVTGWNAVAIGIGG